MPITIIKETIELDAVTTDAEGGVYIQKRINLQEGMVHNLIQTDIFQDTYSFFQVPSVLGEVVISPYPSVPTNMDFQASPFAASNRYPSAGDDAVLFKANFSLQDGIAADINQFPSAQIAANQALSFYTDHIYISLHLMATEDTELKNIAFSFMFTMKSRKVSVLTHSMGVLAESHDAMCALIMSNGHMISKANLRGNVFPMWRYGGIRPENMLSPNAAGSFFLQLPTRDTEQMQSTVNIRAVVGQGRQMAAYDAAFGDRFPDWIRFNLNEGIAAGPVRDQWPPIKHADNGNVLCL
jgi:hypothetical protein